MTTAASPDRVVAAPTDRRVILIEVIRHARREIQLSLFRCSDEAIFQELAAATDASVSVYDAASEMRIGAYGVLKLTLRSSDYDRAFMEAGTEALLDTSSTICH